MGIEFGQIIEGAPYSERDFRKPVQLTPHDEKGDFSIYVKQYDGINELVLDHHPFDVVGWDGYFYPWAFNIMDFEPIVGRVHQPPPVHQTFQGDGFVVCLEDFGDVAIRLERDLERGVVNIADDDRDADLRRASQHA